ncbi:MAG: choice-of-anchor D domain-containing protein [Vicinamibacterales bacterium]
MRLRVSTFLIAASLWSTAASAQLSVTVKDISPDRSTNSDADAATGGRVNALGVDRSTPTRVYAASEWGGLFRSDDSGVTWRHLDGHVPTATSDVEVDPTNSNRVYTASLYDGRVDSVAGIGVSTDAGATWTHPASATPPANFCANAARRSEPSAFAVAIDPANANRVFVGTNCGLAVSTNAGAAWTYVDPTPGDPADDVNDVLVHDGGIIDVCGDDGHLRSVDNGTTWTTATTQPLPGGRCSLAVSPDESYVLFAVVGTSIFESDDGGQSWPVTYANPSPQGRVPFVATNQRAGAAFDLWFGDVGLHRGTCTTPNPATQGGAQRCQASASWAGPFTRANGGHDDTGDIAFAPGVANDACPIYFSSDGGVYRNTLTTSPGCQTPAWAQPTTTPHGLWNYTFAGVSQPTATTEHLYMGNQDNGTAGALNGGAATVTWTNERCCDGFDAAGDGTRALTTVCCFSPGRATLLFVSNPGLTGPSPQVNTYPPGNMRGFEQLESILNFGQDDYVVATTSGVFLTLDIGASPINWTALGAATTPASACGLQVAMTGTTPTFFVKSGGCNGNQAGTLWRYQGTTGTGTWQQVTSPGAGGFGIFAVDTANPQRIIASHLGAPSGPRMVLTLDGGATWLPLPALDGLMTGRGVFRYQNQRGPNVLPGGASKQLNGYPQPTLVAFDPADPDIVVAGGADSGVFLSTNGGTRWQLVTDPIAPGTSGTPHIPRPYYAHFDHDPPAGDINLFLGTRGRGAWRLTFKKVLMPEIQVPSAPTFDPSCLGDVARGSLKVCNTSGGNLVVTSITSSNPEFAVVAPSSGFPVSISHDFCFPFEIAFTPTVPGVRTTTLTIKSNDPNFPVLTVSATAGVGQPTAVTSIADTGNFGQFCQGPGKFRDLPVTINNSGSCPLVVTALASSSPEFEVPQVLTFPMKVAPGDSVALPFRFAPTSAGAKSATLSISTNDPVTPVSVVSVSGTVPPSYVCDPPRFTAIEAAVGPTFGTGRTGDFVVEATGRFLGSFGANRRFGLQVEGDYRFYPGREEGQVDTALLYRRGRWQAGVGGSVRQASLQAELFPGTLGEASASLDALFPTGRFGVFVSKGLKDSDVVGISERLVNTLPGQTIQATERILHNVDTLGGTVQVPLVAPLWWLDGNVVFLNRHAPGVGDTVGAAIRVSRLVRPWLVGMAQFDVNESFVGAHTTGTLTFGVTIGRWPKPQDLTNPVNPLGSLVPRVHYEVFDRVR